MKGSSCEVDKWVFNRPTSTCYQRSVVTFCTALQLPQYSSCKRFCSNRKRRHDFLYVCWIWKWWIPNRRAWLAICSSQYSKFFSINYRFAIFFQSEFELWAKHSRVSLLPRPHIRPGINQTRKGMSLIQNTRFEQWYTFMRRSVMAVRESEKHVKEIKQKSHSRNTSPLRPAKQA